MITDELEVLRKKFGNEVIDLFERNNLSSQEMIDEITKILALIINNSSETKLLYMAEETLRDIQTKVFGYLESEGWDWEDFMGDLG